MLDIVLRGGDVIDGTGAPRRRADVAVRAERIVGVGAVDEPSGRTIDCAGLVVAPGFVDPHTHYDAQVLWDGDASPSPLHGVTTIVGGNCGFTIAPVDESSHDYVLHMLARVEGIPADALTAGLDFSWSSFGEWLDTLEGGLAVNAGFLVGHSTVRRLVMGEPATGEVATERQVEAMARHLHESMAAGALGFSTSRAASHRDHRGDPVPSRHAGADEVIALSACVRDHAGTVLELVPTAEAFFTPDDIELMTTMSLAGQRTLNWNLLGVLHGDEAVRNKLSSADHARRHGARVVPLTMPDPQAMRLTFASGFVYDMLPGWADVMKLDHAAKCRALRDPAVRARLEEGSAGGPWFANWADTTLAEVQAPEYQGWQGRTAGELAAARGVPVFDALCDVVLADDLQTGLVPRPIDDDDEGWRRRAELWRDPRVVIGGSDAGAHLDTLWTFNCVTSLVGPSVRDRGLIDLEEAVRLVTDVPARLYGLDRRGQVREGWSADLVVFDPDTLAPEPVRAVSDLPAGATRLTGGARGIHHVLVNGVEIVRGAQFTGERPGRILRSGRDTHTVPLDAADPGR
jgi:N-acyl-D-aspartate/D-glutamate deacylase